MPIHESTPKQDKANVERGWSIRDSAKKMSMCKSCKKSKKGCKCNKSVDTDKNY